jgi:hypothetical protein
VCQLQEFGYYQYRSSLIDLANMCRHRENAK